MGETPDSLLNLANASGFLFQLRVEQQVKEAKSNWAVETGEYRWVTPRLGEEGYIDIILAKGRERMVVECKRVRNADWLFLVPRPSKTVQQVFPHLKLPDVPRARLLWSSKKENHSIAEYADFQARPPSPESAFCVIRGHGRDKPMLERLSSIVLKSLECLADEELFRMAPGKPRVYIPVIVTTAELKVFNFDVDKVDIQSGEFPANYLSDDQFHQVPWVRFRKSFSTMVETTSERIQTIEQANKEQERTIFIVNATQFSAFLHTWKLGSSEEGWPWERYDHILH